MKKIRGKNIVYILICSFVLFLGIILLKELLKTKENSYEQITEIFIGDERGRTVYATLICREDVQVPDELKCNLNEAGDYEKIPKKVEIEENVTKTFCNYKTNDGYKVLTDYVQEVTAINNNRIYTGFLQDNDFMVLVYVNWKRDYNCIQTYPISQYQKDNAYSNLFDGDMFILDVYSYAGYKDNTKGDLKGNAVTYKAYPDKSEYIKTPKGWLGYCVPFGLLCILRIAVCTILQTLFAVFPFWYRGREQIRFIMVRCAIFQAIINIFISVNFSLYFLIYGPLVLITVSIIEICMFHGRLIPKDIKGVKKFLQNIRLIGYVVISNIGLICVAACISYYSGPYSFILF